MVYDRESADKETMSLIRAIYYEANKERILANNKKSYERNKHKYTEKKLAWARANPEKVKASKKKYREANREQLNQKRREYYRVNKEKKLAQEMRISNLQGNIDDI